MRYSNSKFRKPNLFDLCNYTLMILIIIITLYPFYSQVIASFSSPDYIWKAKVYLFPNDIDFTGWRVMGRYDALWQGYLNTIIRTILAVVLSTLITASMAYPLSKKNMPLNKFTTVFVLITMFFSGGLIPGYILVRQLGMFNTVWAMVLPGLVNAFNVFIMRNFFITLPEAMEESARIDGASYLRVFFSIVLPLSTPVLATIALWVGVANWQEWFSNYLFVPEQGKQVMMMVVRRILVENHMQSLEETLLRMGESKHLEGSPNEAQLKACVIVVSVAPMLLVYPFVQRYFVKGISLGAIKG
jgi:putative aldouronate transport system permease protein